MRPEQLMEVIKHLETDADFLKFGKMCANKHIPELVSELYKWAPHFAQEPPSLRTCAECYWHHQTVKYGCSNCSDASEFVGLASDEARKRHEEYLKSAVSA